MHKNETEQGGEPGLLPSFYAATPTASNCTTALDTSISTPSSVLQITTTNPDGTTRVLEATIINPSKATEEIIKDLQKRLNTRPPGRG